MAHLPEHPQLIAMAQLTGLLGDGRYMADCILIRNETTVTFAERDADPYLLLQVLEVNPERFHVLFRKSKVDARKFQFTEKERYNLMASKIPAGDSWFDKHPAHLDRSILLLLHKSPPARAVERNGGMQMQRLWLQDAPAALEQTMLTLGHLLPDIDIAFPPR